MLQAKKIIDSVLGILLIVLMIVLVIDVVWQVLARYVAQAPTSFTDELARYLLIWVGLFGAAYALGKKRHLAIDLLITRLKGKSRINLNRLINILILGFAVFVMVIGGSRLVWITLTLKQISAALGVPLGVVYLAIPLSGALMIFYAVIDIIHPIRD